MTTRSITSQSLGFAGWFLGTSLAGAAGAVASIQAQTFYTALTRPGWAPPPWLFGPVWSVLYLLMATAAWLIWRRHGFDGAKNALTLFIVQLVANAL